ncbi:porin [Agaribacterium haliotis]|uniref:porin n=1 Tax=Agaribacterium haliotis TaxID=2013869 RepID=UPI001304498F|nr:porin [Agaribacterium haliotis]
MQVSARIFKAVLSAAKQHTICAFICVVFATAAAPVAAQQQSAADRRELAANEDPLLEKIEQKNSGALHSSVDAYGVLYLRYRRGNNELSAVEDNGSRAGVDAYYEYQKQHWLFARYELGFNVFDELNVARYEQAEQARFLNGDSLFTRLAYVGIQTEALTFAFGKNWSSYYQVASFTDRFDSLGGEAHGVYNAGSDGGSAGTGRADNALQSRLSWQRIAGLKSLNVNVQLQNNRPVSGLESERYGLGSGLSLIAELANRLSLGLAYNKAALQPGGEARAAGITGDTEVLLVGAQWYNSHWFVGATYSHSDNLNTDETGRYFNGRGSELYMQYQCLPNTWLLAGFNKIRPDSKADVASYQLDYSVLGLRYSFSDFDRMIYVESRLDDSFSSDGQQIGNQYIIGLRWRL